MEQADKVYAYVEEVEDDFPEAAIAVQTTESTLKELSDNEAPKIIVVPANCHDVPNDCTVSAVECISTNTCDLQEPNRTDSVETTNAVSLRDVVKEETKELDVGEVVKEETEGLDLREVGQEETKDANLKLKIKCEQVVSKIQLTTECVASKGLDVVNSDNKDELSKSNTEVQDEKKDTPKNANVVSSNANNSTDVTVRCDETLDDLPHKSLDEENLLDESTKHINEDDDNQNASVVTDAELTKLVDENSEVVVLTVETIPIAAESTNENFVVTVDEKDLAVSCNENTLILHEKKIEKSECGSEEFKLIDYDEEDDSTVIEVISTEVIQSEDPDTYIQNDNKVCSNIEKLDSIESTKEYCKTEESNNGNIQQSDILEHMQNEKDNEEDRHVIVDTEVKCEPVTNSENDVYNKTVAETCTDSVSEDSISKSKTATLDTIESIAKKRSIIQDIFNEWNDQNPEEENEVTSKVHDTVEIELKSLLDDTKTVPEGTEEAVFIVEERVPPTSKESKIDNAHSPHAKDDLGDSKSIKIVNVQLESQAKPKQSKENSGLLVNKEQLSCSVSHTIGKSSKSITQESVAFNQTLQVTPVKSRNRHLSSQIASPAEVTEVLKERLREKQKIVEAPRGPDIFFVKKITQRLSSKLAGGPVSPIPALIPLPHPTQTSTDSNDPRTTENSIAEYAKEGNSDNKELLAILEGDVDPDWSNLKPPTLIEEGKSPANIEHTEHSSPPKLDPLVERELALKQLLELPVTPAKKNMPKKKKTVKPTSTKTFKEPDTKSSSLNEEKKEIVNIDLLDEDTTGGLAKDATPVDLDSSFTNAKLDSDKEKDVTVKAHDIRMDESRSGRKRKPTEKAREHEQNTTKRQKISKTKLTVNKKQSLVLENIDLGAVTKCHTLDNTLPADDGQPQTDTTLVKEVSNKKLASKVDTIAHKLQDMPLRQAKQSLAKKGSQPIAKRKLIVKKLLRPKISSHKKSTNLKTKLNSSTKSGSKIVPKAPKRLVESTSGDVKPKKKIINEIDRLLQDEGVVNLLYDVEQPDKKRLVPITKSQAKVMDIQKVQRELKIRKKLVRNAVLRLRTSNTGVSKVSPRSKRTAVHVGDSHADRKSGEQIKSPKSATSSEFIFPAKIRNAADASIIIRRHSSSSFSSASGSPRVSIDGPEKQLHDTAKLEDGGTHSLRSTKRRHSQDERINVKRSKQKKTIQKTDSDTSIPNVVENKVSTTIRANKKMDPKKVDKNSKQLETTLNDETIESPLSKVVTRSNGAATGKVTAKSKKTAKSKVTFAKITEPDNNEESSKEDELSACLAEAATALSTVSATGRSGTTAVNRKNKANTAKISDVDNSKINTEVQDQFCNKEINVRRHGNLVQLILTPSSATKIRNALTLQVMQEFRDTLSILRKDDECRVVLLTSTGTSFCEGLDLSTLLTGNKAERTLLAKEMATAVKDFIKSLAAFNKPIVAGVQGAAIGLGVTMLPLFDLVIASDKATFSTPYGKLGQIAEGAAVFTLSHILGSAITSELLLGGRTLTASEALRAGLVTRVLWPDRFQVELLPSLRAMSEQSSQSMEATKALLRHSLRKKLEAALESETYLLVQHWCSAECQTAIKAYIDGKVQ